MEAVTIIIDGKTYSVPREITILEAASLNSIHIPTLCTLKGIDPKANCRLCVVEIEKSRTFMPACATNVSDGMVIRTNTPSLRRSRKHTLELLLSRHSVDCHHCLRIGSSKCEDLDPTFCEMCFFCDCVRDGICELQALAREYQIDVLPYKIDSCRYPIDDSTETVIRNPNKCIKCRRCVDICCEVQAVNALSVINRGKDIQIMPEMGKPLADSPCVQCGRCGQVCPTGAIHQMEHKDEVIYFAHQYGMTTIAQISFDVLKELEALAGLASGELDIRVVASGLKKIGVDVVVSDKFASSMAKSQAIKSLRECIGHTKQPIIITSSYATKQFINKEFASFNNRIITYPSPQQAFSSYVTDIWSQTQQLDAANIRTISVTATNENAAEAARNNSVDYVINARELYRIFMRTGVNLKQWTACELDSFGEEECEVSEFDELLEMVEWKIDSNIKKFEFTVDEKRIKAAIGITLGHTRILLEQVNSNQSPYTVIRVCA